MSSKAVKNAKKTNTVITRNKSSAQQNRQQRTKCKKVYKPLKTPLKIVKENVKTNISENVKKDTPLMCKVRNLVQLVEQVEYYPDKLKRNVYTKKILLKPKPNYKVIATTNKRKMRIPRKGETNTPSKSVQASPSSSKRSKSHGIQNADLSMSELVRLIEESESLSDEDFMEILSCPSPVWWEEAAGDSSRDDSSYTMSPYSISDIEEEKLIDNGNDRSTTMNSSRTTTSTSDTNENFKYNIKQFKISPKVKISENLKAKNKKLENVLVNLKKKDNYSTELDKNNDNTTDCEDLSDLSYSEEDILKNLENMDIPIEQSKEQTNIKKKTDNKTVRLTKTVNVPIKTDLKIPDKLPPLTRKPNIKTEYVKSESYDSSFDFYLDNVSQASFKFITDDDISFVETSNSDEAKIVDKNNFQLTNTVCIDSKCNKKNEPETSKTQNEMTKHFLRKKAANDLSEYITVYKIMSQDEINKESSSNSPGNSPNSNTRGQLNSFFKKRKGNKRLKKNDSSTPATVTDLKIEHTVRPINETRLKSHRAVDNDKSRLNTCNYCVENHGEDSSCKKCGRTPIFECNICNFVTSTKDKYKDHVFSCNDVSRIESKHSTNQT